MAPLEFRVLQAQSGFTTPAALVYVRLGLSHGLRFQGSTPVFGFSTGWVARRHSCQTPLGAALEGGFKEVALLLAHGTEVTDARLMRMCMRDSLLKTVPFLLENGMGELEPEIWRVCYY